MPQLRHAIRIAADPNWTFEACRDVSKWAEFMPAVRLARFIESDRASDIVEITAEANEQVWTWRSARKIDGAARRIAFERLNPTFPILFMRGTWEIIPAGNVNSEVVLVHAFEVANHDPDATEFLVNSIRSNAQRDLQALAQRAKFSAA